MYFSLLCGSHQSESSSSQQGANQTRRPIPHKARSHPKGRNPSSPMVHAAPSDADNPSPPSRLLSKHRPRRRAAPPPPPAPPRPALPPPASTRGQPDLNLCHCCDERFPPPPPGAKRHPVRPLRSLWRIVLLCGECLILVRSAAVCSYCLSLDNLPLEDSSVTCRSCNRCVHQYCIPGEHRTSMIRPIDLENFVCVDCCPTVKPGSKNLEAATREPISAARGKCEAVGVSGKPALIGGGGALERTHTGDLDLLDEELALQLHLEMNGSQRISRTGNGGGSAGQGKAQKGLVAGRKGNGDQGLCVTNMMDQLSDGETGAEMRSNWNAKHAARFHPSVTVVLALECNSKRAHESMRGKRKGPPGTKQHNGLVDRYKKKYSKRNSTKQAKVEGTKSKTMPDGNDMDDDGGVKGIAPIT